LTASYHQTILGLAESTCHSIAWDVSQEILDRRWEVPSQETTNISVHICQSCGSPVCPGWKGTNLRVERPSPATRTVRRREQRKRRRAILAEQFKAKDHKRRPQNTASSSWSSLDTSTAGILRDDPDVGRLDRNHLVLTCGRCRCKTYLKGLRREVHPASTSAETTDRLVTAVEKKRKIQNHSLGDDFISLPKKEPIRLTSAVGNKPNSSLSLLEQKLGRKKKKKTNGGVSKPKSGNLMSFLSSLNDH
jgi:hypothetical protein